MKHHSIILLFILGSIGCVRAQNMSWMQTAQQQEKKSLQLLPMAVAFKDNGAFRPGRGINYGMQCCYGISEKISLSFRHTPCTYFFEDDQISFSYLGVGTKINLISDFLSIMVPVGMNISEYFNVQTDMKLYITKVFANSIAISLCPTINGLIGVYSTYGIGSDLNVSFPIPGSRNRCVIETGYYVWPGSESEQYTFGGIGLQTTFWKTKQKK